MGRQAKQVANRSGAKPHTVTRRVLPTGQHLHVQASSSARRAPALLREWRRERCPATMRRRSGRECPAVPSGHRVPGRGRVGVDAHAGTPVPASAIVWRCSRVTGHASRVTRHVGRGGIAWARAPPPVRAATCVARRSQLAPPAAGAPRRSRCPPLALPHRPRDAIGRCGSNRRIAGSCGAQHISLLRVLCRTRPEIAVYPSGRPFHHP